jgi:hypothetical protein
MRAVVDGLAFARGRPCGELARGVVAVLSASFVVASWCVSAAAQSLTPGGFEIDVHNGPVLGSSRMIGLGGAYSAVAADASGVAWNPASYASRELWETSWFAWDLSAGVLLPSTTTRGDFDNNGDASVGYGGFLYGDLAVGVQFGAFGLGVLVRSFVYEAQVGDQTVSVGLTTGNYGLGYGFLDGQIVVGGGARTAAFTVRTGGAALLQLAGTAPELGAQIRLAGQPWRIGIAYRAGLSVDYEPTGEAAAIARPRPRAAHLPWELQLGVAYQFGDRPLNRRFIDPGRAEDALAAHYEARRRVRAREQLQRERAAGRAVGAEPTDSRWLAEEAERVAVEDAELERDIAHSALRRAAELRALSRRYVLVTGEVVATGATRDGIGLEGYLWGRSDPAGRNVTTSVRVGVELEPWFERLKLRMGGYFEPSRFVGVAGRMHATAGVDVRLGEWDVFGLSPDTTWRLSLVGDVARRYFDWGLGIGVWH